MSALDQVYDSLPYIDQEPTQAQRDRILASLNAAVPANARDELHPSVPTYPEPKFTPLMVSELERVAAKQKFEAIDKKRYELLDAPEEGSGDAAAWRATLQRAYSAHSHLTIRQTNLAMLDETGKNAWLLGNFELEQGLKSIEKELEDTRGEIDAINKARKAAQEGARGELEALDDTWRKGVGRVLETEVATEKLRRQTVELQRKAATG